jgi:hypothetical protein
MKTIFTEGYFAKKPSSILLAGLLLFAGVLNSQAQLGVYTFTGAAVCPNTNNTVTTQPANATFSTFTNMSGTCVASATQFSYTQWSWTATPDPLKYYQFSITPNPTYGLILTGITFNHLVANPVGGTWTLRSNQDNYTADIATGTSTQTLGSSSITLPANFSYAGATTFRLYAYNTWTGNQTFALDNVTVNGSSVAVPANPANPTSNSPQCATPGVTMNFTGTPPAGETWYWQTTASGTSTANSASSYVATTSGTYYVRSQDNTTLAWSTGAGSIAVVITPNVGTPVFALGATSQRCIGAGTVTYAATASASSSILYTLDASSIGAANSIDGATGIVTYNAAWFGTSTITATAYGCNGPTTASHVVNTSNLMVTTPVFGSAASTRCQGAGTVTYAATASNTWGITYSIDVASSGFGNLINTTTGVVTYLAGWNGSTTITAHAAGCGGPLTADHVATITPTVGIPSFSLGATSTRCQGAGTVLYDATATNSTAINYSLDGASAGAGNSINASGEVTFIAGWSGTALVTAQAIGCNGPKTASHTITVTPTVSAPVFAAGASTTRCKSSSSVTYNATNNNTPGITYDLDAVSKGLGLSISTTTGVINYNGGWLGTCYISAIGAGCNGPVTSVHAATTVDNVQDPVFNLGSTSTRCAGAVTITFTATAVNSSLITYGLDGATASFPGNSINPANGTVTFSAFWFLPSTITATAVGCNGPKTATHTVTLSPNVGTPVFASGSTSTRCKAAGVTMYTATASNSTGISYTLDGTTSTFPGNSFDGITGTVTYSVNWVGTSTITATATGCNGPKTATHTVTTNPNVLPPTFTAGATSTRCQGANTVTYTATALNSPSRNYTLDITTSGFPGNSIISTTGAVTFAAGWSGISVITATANGCGGPSAPTTHTVTTTPSVTTPVFDSGSVSTRCQGFGSVLYRATANNNSSAITYSLNVAGGNIIDPNTGLVSYASGWSGTAIITATAAGCNGPKTATHTVTVTPTVGIPSFTAGASSTRCQGAGTVGYSASASNSTGVTYSLDNTSQLAGNSINSSGTVTYVAGWWGTSYITAQASGCNGPSSAVHTVTITATVSAPVFDSGAVSTRCQGGAFQQYRATAVGSTSIDYSIDAASAVLNSINSTTGNLVFNAGWSGTTVVTARAFGCNGPVSSTHTITITPTVGTPVFAGGGTSTRCQGAGTVNYVATATNSTSITYSIDGASSGAGNYIHPTTGDLTYVATWSGNTTVTATAYGCNGPKAATHVVTNTPTVGSPVFGLGLQSVRTQGAGSVTYSATASNSSSITYSLDLASSMAGNTIDAFGKVTWTAGWFGASSITASAIGCNGPSTSSHIVNTNPSVVQTPLYLSGPGQFLDRVDPVATNITTTEVSYPISSSSTALTTDASSIITGLTSPVTLSHTTGTGANRFMLVGISQRNRTVTSVTYGTTPLTLVGDNNNNGNARISIYQLVNPPSGTATITVNFSSSPDKGAVVSVTTYSGVDQTNPLGTFATAQATSTNPTVTVNSSTGDLIYDVVAIRNQTVTVGAGQTQRWNLNSGSDMNGAGSTKPGSGSTNMSWTSSSSADWAIGAVAIKPAVSVNTITFTQEPVLCSPLTIKAQPIQALVHVNITSGTMPVNPTITAQLKYGSTNIVTLSNPVYNAASKILSWTGTLVADATIPTGQALDLVITSTQTGVQFQIEYHSNTKPSRISLLPVSTFVDFQSFDVFTAPYPGGLQRLSGLTNTTYYVRAKITTPFGYKDITGMDLRINPPGSTFAVNCIDSTTCTRTYEYAWTTPATTNTYFIMGTAKEGYENLIKNSDLLRFDVCSACPPVALNDSATGAGGAPLVVNALANDYDPNNNLKPSTLAINLQPNNGTGYISNGKIVYLPNGSYAGRDTLTYSICDSTSLCTTAQVFFTINPTIVDPCSEAAKTTVYYVPFAEDKARIALVKSASVALATGNIRTVISLKMPYPGMTIVWDQWEDGYELNALDPLQATTVVWGDGNPYNGIAPGYANDIIPAGASIVLDNTMPANPRVQANVFYDGRDKVTTSGMITMTQVCGEPSIIGLQCMKTNVTPVKDFGSSFTIPAGENFNSQDFKYSALFIRAAKNNTLVEIDKDNNGSLETTATLNEGEIMLVDGGVLSGATIAASENVGVELHFGGVDSYSSREVPIYPATWYSHTYYSPVPTTGRTTSTPRDTAVVMLYNSLNRPLSINWFTTATPSSGTITLPAKSTVRFPLAYSSTAAYKFVNPTGESFTAIEIVDSYTPGGGGNSGLEFDWSFNLISENRLTDYATIAWAPGSTDGTRNDNPVWVTPTANTTIYVKWDGNVNGNTGLIALGCGLRYDVSYSVPALTHRRLFDTNDNDQSGMAVFTCDGTKLAAVYGEDPSTAVTANPSWDVGSTIQPFCKQKLIFANDDYARTMVNQPVTIPILLNDFGFLAVIDPGSVTTVGLLQPKNGTVTVNANGTVIYLPNPGYTGKDTFEYSVCSTPTPIVCDKATVYVDISVCPAPYTQNVIAGQVFLDKNDDGIYNDGGTGVPNAKVYLYVDGNCNQIIDANEIRDSVITDSSGSYQFINYPEKFVMDDFDGPGGTRTCANGSDGNAAWKTDWKDINDNSYPDFCTGNATPNNSNAEIFKDGAFGYGLRLRNPNVSAYRTVDLTGASYAFLTFSYRRKSATLTAGRNVIVQASSNGSAFSTVYTITGDGTTDPNYVTIYNQDITAFASATTQIRFLTNATVGPADTVYIDNVKIQFIRYPICYITRLDPSTVPAYHHTTTVLQHSLTAVSAQTCFGPFYYGIAKNKVAISGTLFQDANGLTDAYVNGTAIGTIGGNPVYAYLTDSTGKVVQKTTLNAAMGTYSFPNADMFTNYTLSVSKKTVNLGEPPPPNAGMELIAGNWVTTGDAFGINNAAGTGNKPGAANCIIAVRTSSVNVTGVNFGVERLPDSDDRTITYPRNDPDIQYDVTGGLTGSDPEDGILGTGKTYKVTQLPFGAVLYYNGSAVSLNQVITSFTPALLKIDPDDDTHQAIFMYASMDAAGLFDPTPAQIVINWARAVPVRLISFSGRLNGSRVDLNWVTATELNTRHFEVQRSIDGINFVKIATVAARGTSTNVNNYDLVDPSPFKGINYYRLKTIDFDDKYEYSQIVIIRIDGVAQLVTKVAPNPFTGKVDVYLTLTHNTPVDFRFIDFKGAIVFRKTVKGLKGFNWFTINDLEKLQSAPYLLHIVTDDQIIVEKLIKQ